MSDDPFRPDLTPEVREALATLLSDKSEPELPAGTKRFVLLNILEAARLLEMDRTSLYRLSKAGLIRSYPIRGVLTFNLFDVRRFDRSTRVPVKARKRVYRTAIPVRLRFRILERDGFRCVYCGSTAQDGKLVLDHVVSVADGGSDDESNLVTACEPCNSGKGKRSLQVVA